MHHGTGDLEHAEKCREKSRDRAVACPGGVVATWSAGDGDCTDQSGNVVERMVSGHPTKCRAGWRGDAFGDELEKLGEIEYEELLNLDDQ